MSGSGCAMNWLVRTWSSTRNSSIAVRAHGTPRLLPGRSELGRINQHRRERHRRPLLRGGETLGLILSAWAAGSCFVRKPGIVCHARLLHERIGSGDAIYPDFG